MVVAALTGLFSKPKIIASAFTGAVSALQTAYQFWKNDFDRYSNEALDPPKHKLSKLLVSGTVSLMLSQPENLIDFRQIMDNKMILLVNLSTIGSEVREILGCFIYDKESIAGSFSTTYSICSRLLFFPKVKTRLP